MERQRLFDFANVKNKEVETEMRLRELVCSRRDWAEKFTPGELDLIEKCFGAGAFDRFINIHGKTFGDQWDGDSELMSRFGFLEKIKGVPPPMYPTFKKAFELATDSLNLPPVSPMVGFPDNRDVIAWITRGTKCLKKALPSYNNGFVAEVVDDIFDDIFKPVKSPFGPVSSSACFEELDLQNTANLRQLLTGSGLVIPHTKILLTVVHEAVVSPRKIVTMVVEDGDGQYIPMQIHNMNGIQPTVAGLKYFPIGSRFFLKNPFMQLGFDGWLTLRVDQPFDLERIDLPPLRGDILVVGDGDFSFSVALAKQNRERGDAFIVTTSLDTDITVRARYAKGALNLETLEADDKAKVCHEIDATVISSLGDNQWDSIVWNFPYPVDQTISSASNCRSLLGRVLGNMRTCLKHDGRVYITLAHLQGGTSREAAASSVGWDVETLAMETGLRVVEVLPFHEQDYDGYEPKRAYNDASFPRQNAKTHVLQLDEDKLPGEGPSERTVFSRLASFILDQAWGPSSHNHKQWKSVLEELQPLSKSSRATQLLINSALSFGQALDVMTSTTDRITSTTDHTNAISIEPCDRMLPQAHYHAGLCCLTADFANGVPNPPDFNKARKHYTQGLDAEQHRLSFLAPNPSDQKRLLGILLFEKSDGSSRTQAKKEKEDPCTKSVKQSVETKINVDWLTAKTIESQKDPNKSTEDEGLTTLEEAFYREIKQILVLNPNGLRLAQFKDEYRKEFNKAIPLEGRLGKLMERAAKSGVCTLEKKGTTCWLKPYVNASIKPAKAGKAFYRDIKKLLTTQPSEGLHIAQFKREYEKVFGKPVPTGHLTTLLKQAAFSGACTLKDGVWITSTDRKRKR
jgi:hypothetical protein